MNIDPIKAIKIDLAAIVDGTRFKGLANVPPAALVEISWAADAGRNCISNWKEGLMPLVGNQTSNVSASRTFIITCFGVGAAQTAKLTVTVVRPDLTVPRLDIEGLVPLAKKGTYKAGPLTFQATVKNGGKLGIAPAAKVSYSYQMSNTPDKASFQSFAVKPLLGSGGLSAGTSELVEPHSFAFTAAPTTKWYFQACADFLKSVDESNETNNCSKVSGPYIFAN